MLQVALSILEPKLFDLSLDDFLFCILIASAHHFTVDNRLKENVRNFQKLK